MQRVRCGVRVQRPLLRAVRCSARTASPAPPTGAATPPAGKRALRLELLVGLTLAGALALFIFFQVRGTVEGQIAVAGPRGTFTFSGTGCSSMQPYGRFGVVVHGGGTNDGAVYVTQDPLQGPAVDIEVPGSCRNADGTDCIVFSVPRDRCTLFEPHVEGSGVVVNRVRLMEGHVRLDCTLEDGTSVRGSLEFDGC